ncbi:MAG: class I SAM-dependent methyltransferase [Nitrospinae bacterium]|nr:class I SAM-dependent methyltransferase [Nitrospinota bacterium]
MLHNGALLQTGPEDVYGEYSTVFDYFSDERFSPSNKYFMDFVAGLLGAKSKVCEVGGGTGYFSRMLLKQRPDVELLLVEPSESMLERARPRLGKQCVFMKNRLDQVIHALDKQDVFIFQRSFYHLHKDVDSYQLLIKRLYDLTNDRGFVCIQDVPPVYDLEAHKRHLREKHLELGLSLETFDEKWPVLETALKDYNERVARNEYYKFPQDALIVFFLFAGFSLLHFSADHGVFFFFKPPSRLIDAKR